jgi:hypothetical protein
MAKYECCACHIDIATIQTDYATFARAPICDRCIKNHLTREAQAEKFAGDRLAIYKENKQNG